MSRQQNASDRERGLLTGAWEWLADAEAGYRVATKCVLVPTIGKGRFGVRMVAEVWREGEEIKIVAQVTNSFPNSSNQTLAGLILAMSMSLERILSHWALDQAGLTLEAPQEA